MKNKKSSNQVFFPAEELERLNAIIEKIIGFAYQVSNELGYGFLEKVYENALAHVIRKAGMHCDQKQPLKVWYDGIVVGDFEADLLVENCVIVELKTVRELTDIHKAQCLNYLKATQLHVCLLINFGNPRVEVKRLLL